MSNFLFHEVKNSRKKVCGEERLERGKRFVKLFLFRAETHWAEA
jgi:hypothetical protein